MLPARMIWHEARGQIWSGHASPSEYEFGQFCISICVILKLKEIDMAKGQQRSNREAKKPKKKKIKVIAAAPSQKGAGWQPTFADAKRK
jgi:hypothetical protein